MNLYDLITRKIYMNDKNNIPEDDEEEDTDNYEDDNLSQNSFQNESGSSSSSSIYGDNEEYNTIHSNNIKLFQRLRQRRTGKVYENSDRNDSFATDKTSSVYFHQPYANNEFHFDENWDGSENDVTLRVSYEKYRYLKRKSNALQARRENRNHFVKILAKISIIKRVVCAFLVFYLTFSLTMDILQVESFNSTVPSLLSSSRLNLNQFIQLISYCLCCLGMASGLLFGFRYCPQANCLSLNYHGSLFIMLVAYSGVLFIETVGLFLHYFEIVQLIPVSIAFKSALVGFLFIYCLYALFDINIGPINKTEAQRSIRILISFITLGIKVSLTIYLSYFVIKGTSHGDLLLTVFTLGICRVFITMNCCVILFLIWYGIGNLTQYSSASLNNIHDFLSNLEAKNFCDNCQETKLSLSCVCFACQTDSDKNIQQIDADNCSIRTVKLWRRACYSFFGTILFLFAFSAEMFQLFFSTIWPQNIYPSFMTETQIFWAQMVLFNSVVVARRFIAYRIAVDENSSELIRNYSWPKICRRLLVVYLLHIGANLSLLYLAKYSFIIVVTINVFMGISLGLFLELIVLFISRYVTITPNMIQCSLITTLVYVSMVSLFIYNSLLTDKPGQMTNLIYLNLTGSGLSVLIVFIVARSQCLVSKRSFDLLQMQNLSPYLSSSSHSFNEANNNTTITATFKQQLSNTGDTSGSIKSLHSAISDNHSNHTTDLANHSTLVQGPSVTIEPVINQQSSNYWYRFANSGHRRSTPAVIAYRIKYRLESIASILMKDN